VRRLLAPFLCVCLSACLGRSPNGEFRLDRLRVGPGEFDNALFQTVGAQLRPGHRIDVVDNGRVFEAAVEEIGRARRSIHIVSFIWSDGAVSNRLIDAIAAKTREGVQCRVIVDALGSPGFSGVKRRLDSVGCEAHHFRPLPGQDDVAREHRKMVIVDGRVGITGGFGIDDRWDGDGRVDEPPQWRDANLRVRGPAVLEMQQAFAESWQEATGSLLPRDAFPAAEEAGPSLAAFVSSSENSVATRSDRLTQLLIASASRRIWISNAYFVPSTPILELLTRKAREGLDVRILAAGDRTDTKPYLVPQRERMDRLVREGVKAYEYGPTMMHAKVIVVDDRIVSVGSCNLDALSLNKMDEGAVVAVDEKLAEEEARRFLQDLAVSQERRAPASDRKTAGR